MLIQTDSHLAEFCAEIRGEGVIFLDTEFVSESRYYAELGTIQLGSRTQAALVDPLTVRDLTPLGELLADPQVEKVFHAAQQDLMIFFRLFSRPVAPIFDTQVAAALLGYDEQISFGNLVERVTKQHLEKGHGFTDWLRRPLTAGQVEYALDDVRYLVPIYDALQKELTQHQRQKWAREEFARLEEPTRFAPADPHELYLRLRGVERLSGTTLAAARELVAWREETARALNIPTGRVARDEVLMELARRPRQTTRELREIRGMLPPQIDQFGAGLIAAALQGVNAPRPVIARRVALPTALDPTVDFLVLCLRSLAREMGVSPGLVATRADLTALVLHGEQADTPLMRGWRRTAIGDGLLATLQGHATARIIPETRQVHLEWREGCG